MNRFAAYLLGPELIWLFGFGITLWLIARNQPATLAGNEQLETIGWFLPVGLVLLSFVPLLWAPGSQWIWLLRIVLVGAAGVLLVTGDLCGAIDYKDSRNSGVGSAFVLFVGLGYITLFAGAFIAAFFILTNWNFIPVLKWGLFIIALLGSFLGAIFWLASLAKLSTDTAQP